MAPLRILGFLACLVLLASVLALPALASPPPYATEGAFASYTAEGGFIPYFSGVEGNITYTVAHVFPNNSMSLRIFENITAGTDLNPFITLLNVTDSVSHPKIFPAVPVANLTTMHIEFQNVSATFLGNSTASVPAGSFRAMEFQGRGANDTTVSFWFDGATGLMVEENSGTSAVELESSNIATPSGPAGFLDSVLPYELVFVAAFVIGGSVFLYMRHHYTRQAAKKAAQPKQ